MAIAEMARKQQRSLTCSVACCDCARDAEGIEAVQVAAGRKDFRSAQQISAGGGADIPAIECTQDGGDLVIARQLVVELAEIVEDRDPETFFTQPESDRAQLFLSKILGH